MEVVFGVWISYGILEKIFGVLGALRDFGEGILGVLGVPRMTEEVFGVPDVPWVMEEVLGVLGAL